MVCRTSIPGAVLGLGSAVSPLRSRGWQTQPILRGYAVGIISRAP